MVTDSETIPSLHSPALLEEAGNGREGMDGSESLEESSLPNRTRNGKTSPHVLLTANEASQLLRLVTQSRPMDCGQMELVADLARHVAAARGIEVRHAS